jgi:hypothetical protein
MNAITELDALKEVAKQTAPADPVKSCKYGGGRFEVGKGGVSFIGKDNEGNDKAPERRVGAAAGLAGR